MPKIVTKPDARGHFGPYGGMYVPETLMSPLMDLAAEYQKARRDSTFRKELGYYLREYVGRPTPLYFAEHLSEKVGVRVYLKREDLCHTGAHKINNCMGQILLARRMGKQRIIAETGAGQHGVATATVAAMFGFECVIYMGKVDMERQALNVFRMESLGATVVPVVAGQQTLKEAISEAMRDWVTNVSHSHYVLGSVLGSHPYPMMVRDFQSVIGREARRQCLKQTGRLPSHLVACIGGGSNAIGLFYPFINDPGVAMIGVEAGGAGIKKGQHAARLSGGRMGILQGTKTFILQDRDGQISLTHSVSAGLDYAAVGPEHSLLRDLGRSTYTHVSDREAVEAFDALSRWEGILPALESAHAVAYLQKNRKNWRKRDLVVLNLSGRGDKDVQQVMKWKKKHARTGSGRNGRTSS